MITMSQLSSIRFPRTATGSNGENVPNLFVLDTVINALIANGEKKICLSQDFMVSVFAPAFFADDDACRIFRLEEWEAEIWKKTRDQINFGAETGINGQMVMPIYFQFGESPKVTQLSVPDSHLAVPSFVGLIFNTFYKFKEMLNGQALAFTPNYDLCGANQYKKNELVVIRTATGSDATAVVRHIFDDLKCDNDATIYDMIVTPVGSSRLIRVHSVDILPLGYTKSLREVEEKRANAAIDKANFRMDVLNEFKRMLPKEGIGDMIQRERKVPQNAAQSLMQFGRPAQG